MYSLYSINLRRPTIADGAALHDLVGRCPPLDENSRYCNLLQVAHFADTSIVAEAQGDDRLCGFVTGYRIPDRQDTLFVWQVGVAPEARGLGLAWHMLTSLIDRVDGVEHLETTVTPDNQPSQRVFESVAQELRAPISRSTLFGRTEHFQDEHEDEVLYRIGPFGALDQQHPAHLTAAR